MAQISSHSGLTEEVELKQMKEKSKIAKEKRETQIKKIRSILDKMPTSERRAMISWIIKMYREKGLL